jgi:hypothetical protein
MQPSEPFGLRAHFMPKSQYPLPHSTLATGAHLPMLVQRWPGSQ